MAGVATTKLSSKGQVVIPDMIRKKLKLKAGSQFVVIADKDVVILKAILPPTIDEFDELIAKARKSAKDVGLRKTDIKNAIAKVRGKKWKLYLISKVIGSRFKVQSSRFKGYKHLGVGFEPTMLGSFKAMLKELDKLEKEWFFAAFFCIVS